GANGGANLLPSAAAPSIASGMPTVIERMHAAPSLIRKTAAGSVAGSAASIGPQTMARIALASSRKKTNVAAQNTKKLPPTVSPQRTSSARSSSPYPKPGHSYPYVHTNDCMLAPQYRTKVVANR